MNSNTVENLIDLEVSKRLAKYDFYEYCQYREPEFYLPHRKHLEILCNTLNNFIQDKLLKENGEPYKKIMIRIPPQNGKTRTLVNLTQWCLGRNNEERIISASYNDTQASDYSRYTRDGIQEIKNVQDQRVFSDVFPDCKIKYGNASYQKWALEGQHFNYLGVGVGGGVTGKGATIRIIDDLVKDVEDALSDTAMEKKWRWFSGTFSSRTSAEEGEIKEIYCATLWGENDPQYILEQTEKEDWYILSMPVYDNEKDKMLCEDFMNKEAFIKLKKRMCLDSKTSLIFQANYMCEAISDSENNIFSKNSLTYYDKLPKGEYFTIGQIDPADEGTDYFSFPIARVYGNIVYLIDAIFDQENLTLQEPKVQGMQKLYKFAKIVIETNHAGAYFSRRIRTLLKKVEIFGKWSSANKMARIIQYAGLVKLYFRFPNNPTPALQRFMNQLWKLKNTSKKEDDAGDSLSGLAEHLEKHYRLFD